MKRIISTTIALLTVQAAAQSPAPLTFWYEQANPSGQRALQKNLIDPFNASQKACRLTLDVRGANLDKQLRVALLSGGGPDIVLTAGPSIIAAMAEAGQLLSLEPYAAKYGWKGKILPVAYDTGIFNKQLYALPKTPLQIISLWFPVNGLSEEFKKTAQDFMQNLPNPEIGDTVCDRFNQRAWLQKSRSTS